MNLTKLRHKIKWYGIKNTFLSLFQSVVNRFIFFNIYKCVVITEDSANMPQYSFENPGDGYCWGLLGDEQLMKYEGKQNNLSKHFLESAKKKKDWCYALLHNDELAAYNWNSKYPTNLIDDLWFCFNNDYVYGHNSYTNPKFRGQGLNVLALLYQLKRVTQDGYKGLVGVINAHNFSMLKSGSKVGWKDICNIYVIKLFGTYFISGGDRSQEYGVCITTKNNAPRFHKRQIEIFETYF